MGANPILDQKTVEREQIQDWIRSRWNGSNSSLDQEQPDLAKTRKESGSGEGASQTGSGSVPESERWGSHISQTRTSCGCSVRFAGISWWTRLPCRVATASAAAAWRNWGGGGGGKAATPGCEPVQGPKENPGLQDLCQLRGVFLCPAPPAPPGEPGLPPPRPGQADLPK
ncbi:hypothetical protein chiPu_0026946 [Chiloscyllium punctatum]|uniref:Uncharacterized protein n=1 Tax=Chiloscyllium punctatum TaxID=137246 RepID=A0A401TKT2_CHIPU|nr:hypothetical protein [Chiloscyllium punctatum]